MKTSSLLTGLAAAIVALGLTVVSAMAYPAVTTSNVNVRSGPGTGFGVVTVLSRGQQVEVNECRSGWCNVSGRNLNGWISQSFLASPGGGGGGVQPQPQPQPQPSGPGFNFGVVIGPDGKPTFNIGIGNQPKPQPPQRQAACFYSEPNYGGYEFCVNKGDRYSNLRDWDNLIWSVRLYGDATADICADTNFRGTCQTLTSSRPRLGFALGGRVSSLEVY